MFHRQYELFLPSSLSILILYLSLFFPFFHQNHVIGLNRVTHPSIFYISSHASNIYLFFCNTKLHTNPSTHRTKHINSLVEGSITNKQKQKNTKNITSRATFSASVCVCACVYVHFASCCVEAEIFCFVSMCHTDIYFTFLSEIRILTPGRRR